LHVNYSSEKEFVTQLLKRIFYFSLTKPTFPINTRDLPFTVIFPIRLEFGVSLILLTSNPPTHFWAAYSQIQTTRPTTYQHRNCRKATWKIAYQTLANLSITFIVQISHLLSRTAFLHVFTLFLMHSNEIHAL